MLERWDRLFPNEQRLTFHRKAILCSSYAPDQGFSPASTTSPPALSSLHPRVLPRDPYSVLSSATASSVGCWRLRTWYLGLPLVPHPLCGVSGLTQPDAHPGATWKTSAVLPCPPAQSTGTLVGRGFSPIPLFPQHSRPGTFLSPFSGHMSVTIFRSYVCHHLQLTCLSPSSGHMSVIIFRSPSFPPSLRLLSPSHQTSFIIHTHTQRERQTDRKTDRHRDTERQTQRET